MKNIEEQFKEAKTNMKIIGNYNLYLSKKYYKFIFYRRICVILAIFTFVAVIMLYTGKLIVPYLTFFKIAAGVSFWVLVILCAYFSKEKEDCLNSVATCPKCGKTEHISSTDYVLKVDGEVIQPFSCDDCGHFWYTQKKEKD